MAGAYFGILTWAQGWDYAMDQFLLNRWYMLPIFTTFGVQAALYFVLRFRLFGLTTRTSYTGITMGTSGSLSITAMVTCCLHHVTDVLPILGISAVTAFLVRYQRPFMLASLGLNLAGIIVMFAILRREQRKLQSARKIQPALETQ